MLCWLLLLSLLVAWLFLRSQDSSSWVREVSSFPDSLTIWSSFMALYPLCAWVMIVLVCQKLSWIYFFSQILSHIFTKDIFRSLQFLTIYLVIPIWNTSCENVSPSWARLDKLYCFFSVLNSFKPRVKEKKSTDDHLTPGKNVQNAWIFSYQRNTLSKCYWPLHLLRLLDDCLAMFENELCVRETAFI